MNNQSFSEEIHHIIGIISGVLFLLLIIHTGVVFFNIPNNDYLKKIVLMYDRHLYFIRLLYVASLFVFFYIKPTLSPNRREDNSLTRIINYIIIAIFVMGYINMSFYDMIIYPFLLILSIYSVNKIVQTYAKKIVSDSIFGISNKKPFKYLYYDYKTKDGDLRVHSAEQHMYIGGGSGAGKGDSIIKPTIYQHIERFDKPALIYDVKPEMPLTKTAFNAFFNGLKEGRTFESKLVIFNISNPGMSFRINTLSKRYISKDTPAFLNEQMQYFLTNYQEEWRDPSKRDHWYKASLTVFMSLSMRFLVDDKIRDKLSFPMLCELLLTHKVGSVINFILDKEESARMLSQIRLSAIGSFKQFTGEFSTVMSGLSSIIFDKNLYWLLSNDEVNLDINNPNNNTVLCIGGSEEFPTVYTPFIAAIISIVMRYFREENKLPTLFDIDEINTIYLEHLPRDANKFRSNGVCLQIGNQLMTMLQDMYGDKKANNLFGACGNQFFGMGNDAVTSGILEKMLGEIEVENISYSTSENSKSVSTSLKKTKAMSIRTINEQNTGHMTGKIANGDPAYFSTQFERYEYADSEVPIENFVIEKYGGEENLKKEIDTNYNAIRSFAASILNEYPNKLPEGLDE